MNTNDITVVFQTERLTVRRYQPDDQENFFIMNGDEEIVRYIRPAKSRDESDRFLQEVIQYSEENPLFGRWAVNERETGNFVGTFAIIPVEGTDNLQLGYSLVKPAWGKGYATELTVAGIDYFFKNTPCHELYALTDPRNSSSQMVLLKAGFIQSGSLVEEGKEILEFVYIRDR